LKGEASAYELYCQEYGYEGTEAQWLQDLVNGDLYIGKAANGDVNNDGKVDMDDVNLVLNMLNANQFANQEGVVGAEDFTEYLQDIYKDGVIDYKDVSALLISVNYGDVVINYELENTVGFVYGDTNLDGVVNIRDVAPILQYQAGWNVLTSDDEKMRADVFMDGKIDDRDVKLIQEYFAGWNVSLPTPATEAIGDVNMVYIVDRTDIDLVVNCIENGADIISEEQQKLADVYQDGNIDYKDVAAIYHVIENGKVAIDYDLEETIGFEFGDADLDGEITIRDVSMISQYAAGWNVMSRDDAKIRADVFMDGKIDEKDIQLIMNKMSGNDVTIPTVITTRVGDIDLDGVVDMNDALSVLRYINGNENILTPKQLELADVYQDGNLDEKDVAAILVARDSDSVNFDYNLDFVYGDTNLDGEITIRDVSLILQYAAGWDVMTTDDAKIRADVFMDGKIDEMDTKLILQKMAGWNVTLPTITLGYAKGDVNLDGVVNEDDYTLLSNYLSGQGTLEETQKIFANVAFTDSSQNAEVQIDNCDLAVLRRYLDDGGKTNIEDYCAIKFDLNGETATNTISEVQVFKKGARIKTLPIPEVEGKTFKGWFTTTNGEITANDTQITKYFEVTESLVLMAKW